MRCLLFVAALSAACLSICSCGGGTDAPPLVAVASPALPQAASIAGTRTVLTEVSGACAQSSSGCISHVALDVNAGGDLMAFWLEVESGDSARTVAARSIAGTATLQSKGTVDPSISQSRLEQLTARWLGGFRFALFYDSSTFFEPFPMQLDEALVVDMGPSVPAATPRVRHAGDFINNRTIVQDNNKQLYSLDYAGAQQNPPIDIGNGVLLTYISARNPSAAQTFRATSWTDYESTDPRALRAFHLKETATSEPHLYVSDQNLVSGVLSPLSRISVQAVPESSPNCRSLTVQSAGVSTSMVAWHQPKPAADGCDLFVHGRQMNSPSTTNDSYAFAGRDGDWVVVWTDRAGTSDAQLTSSRVLSSRRDQAGYWSAPAPVAPQLSSADEPQTLGKSAFARSGALAIAWSAGPGFARASFISKFVSGAWVTVAAPGGQSDAAGDQRCRPGSCSL